MLWHNTIDVYVQSFNVGHIDVLVKAIGFEVLRVTCFYGNLVSSQMRHSWELLRRLDYVNQLSWIILGDFH